MVSACKKVLRATALPLPRREELANTRRRQCTSERGLAGKTTWNYGKRAMSPRPAFIASSSFEHRASRRDDRGSEALILLPGSDRIGELGPLDDGRGLHDLLAEDVALDEVREPRGQFVVDETFCRDGEDLCKGVYVSRMRKWIKGNLRRAYGLFLPG